VTSMQRSKGISVLRDISTSILKNDTRSVDELARARNNLMVILPSVGRDGAQVCGKRLESKMRKYLEQHLHNGELERILSLDIYEYPEDKAEVGEIIAQLRESVED